VLRNSCASHGSSCVDDFYDNFDSVFINDFKVDSNLGMLTISVSAIELSYVDNFWVNNDSVFINDF